MVVNERCAAKRNERILWFCGFCQIHALEYKTNSINCHSIDKGILLALTHIQNYWMLKKTLVSQNHKLLKENALFFCFSFIQFHRHCLDFGQGFGCLCHCSTTNPYWFSHWFQFYFSKFSTFFLFSFHFKS